MLLSKEVQTLLQTSEKVKDRVGLLTLGGSLAYGTNLPDRGDIDIRGFAYEPLSQIIGRHNNFDQLVDTATDTVIYSFTKMVGLLLENNPNTLEILGCKPEHYFFVSEPAQVMIDNRSKFLSRRVIHTFGGYAKQQLERLENAIARDSLSQAKKEEHIKSSVERTMLSFNDRYADYPHGAITLHIEPSTKPEFETEILVDISLKNYPIRQLNSIFSEISNTVGQYSKINHRNKKKDEEHLDKHAMHIIRLMYMAFDALERGELNTYRAAEQELLLSIRKGAFRNADGTYNSAYYDLKASLDTRFEYAKLHTVLPENPDLDWVNDFTMETYTQYMKGGITTWVA